MNAPDLSAIKNLRRNAWNWDLNKFCAVLGWEPDIYSQEKFKKFQAARLALADFDIESLNKMCGDYREETPTT